MYIAVLFLKVVLHLLIQCMCTYSCMLCHSSESQRTTCISQFSLTSCGSLGLNLGYLGGKCFYLLSHLTSPQLYFIVVKTQKPRQSSVSEQIHKPYNGILFDAKKSCRATTKQIKLECTLKSRARQSKKATCYNRVYISSQ